MSKAQRSIQYRYLERNAVAGTDETLEDIVRAALRGRRDEDVIGDSARARIADLDQSGQQTLWNDLRRIEGGALAGELVRYRQGFDVPAIVERLDRQDDRFERRRFQTDGESKPIEGVLYFAIIGDSVGLIASQTLGSSWLERYLTWLSKEIALIIEGDSHIALNQKISVAGQPPSVSGEARSLKMHVEPVSGGGGGEQLQRRRRERAAGRGTTVLEVLTLLGLGDDAIESIRRDIPEGGELEGDFQVFIKEGRYRRPVSTDTLDHAFRNLDPNDIEIERKGSKVKDNFMSLSEPTAIEELPDGLDRNDAVEKIIEQMYRWENNGTVTLRPQ